jgi:putative MATE family efflux protein
VSAAGAAGAASVRERMVGVWRRMLGLSWPIMLEQLSRTGMRTTDVVVTALFSPAAIAAVGLAGLYSRFTLWVGLGTGGGAIALSSQDTGSGAAANRAEAVSGALVLGAVAGLPFAAFGLLFGEEAIALLGAPPAVARMGGLYMAIVFVTAPARHVGLIGARALQGTGDTRTPMYVNLAGNSLNILLSVTLGLGLLGAPRLEVAGVAAATAVANVAIALALVALLASRHTEPALTVPTDPVIARQLVVVSAPSIAEGLASTLAEFPFNAILLGFGTEVNAGFQIGRRAYQQVTGPLSRGYNVAVSVVVGQSLGEGRPEDARFDGWAALALGVFTVGGAGLLLAAVAPWLVGLLTGDAATASAAVGFARVYGLTGGLLVTFTVLQGALRGASETRAPFLARASGFFGLFVGVTYLVGVVAGAGVGGAYLAIVLTYAWMAGAMVWWFRRGGWAERAARMMAERGSLP